jgi:type I pantothenate kinase
VATGHNINKHLIFSKSEWAALRNATPLSLSEDELQELAGRVEQITLEGVRDIYLPLSRFLNLRVEATSQIQVATADFFNRDTKKRPFLIGVAGSVSAGKSTTARILQAVLSEWPQHPKVDLVTTDGFLQPNAELEEKGLLGRKGFPESYRRGALVEFLHKIVNGVLEVEAPVYSHVTYDITDEVQVVQQPDILIVEGLNVLQTGSSSNTPFVSDYFDFTIYVDAETEDLEKWYVERFQQLRATAFRENSAYFVQFSHLPPDAAEAVARTIWRSINLPNLQENIIPTRARADLILRKGPDHDITSVELRRN